MICGPDPNDPMLQSEFEPNVGTDASKIPQLRELGVHRLIPTFIFHCFVTGNPGLYARWETTSPRSAALLFANESFDPLDPPQVFVTTRAPNGEEVRWHVHPVRRDEARIVGLEDEEVWTPEELKKSFGHKKPLLKLV